MVKSRRNARLEAVLAHAELAFCAHLFPPSKTRPCPASSGSASACYQLYPDIIYFSSFNSALALKLKVYLPFPAQSWVRVSGYDAQRNAYEIHRHRDYRGWP